MPRDVCMVHGPAKSTWRMGAILATLPILAFALQLACAVRDQTTAAFFGHFTVSYIDWVFVPFNLLVVWVIDWRRGWLLYAITALSLAFNAATHAVWQYNPGAGGHMITSAQVVLAGGWVHLVYSTLQTSLLAAFVFARREQARFVGATTALAVCYLVAAAVSGYVMNAGFILTDAIAFSTGLFLVLVYPRYVRGRVGDSGNG